MVSKAQLAIAANNLSVTLANYKPVNFHVNGIMGRFCRQFTNYEFDSPVLFTVAINASIYQTSLCASLLSNTILRA